MILWIRSVTGFLLVWEDDQQVTNIPAAPGGSWLSSRETSGESLAPVSWLEEAVQGGPL